MPSPPLAVQGEVTAIPDVFGPEAYGIGRTVAQSRGVLSELTEEEAAEVVRLVEAESGLALCQRKMGVNIPASAIRCSVVVVAGTGTGSSRRPSAARSPRSITET